MCVCDTTVEEQRAVADMCREWCRIVEPTHGWNEAVCLASLLSLDEASVSAPDVDMRGPPPPSPPEPPRPLR